MFKNNDSSNNNDETKSLSHLLFVWDCSMSLNAFTHFILTTISSDSNHYYLQFPGEKIKYGEVE